MKTEMTGVSIGQETGRARARDLLRGDVLPEHGWASVSATVVTGFGLVGVETSSEEIIATEPDRVFVVAEEVRW